MSHAELDEVHRYSLDEYHQLIESGGSDEHTRVELIDGLLLDKGVKSRGHENAIEWLARWLFGAVDLDRFMVRVSAALTLERSEPAPDLFVAPRDAHRPYHPGTASLVIEVSVSSLRRRAGAAAARRRRAAGRRRALTTAPRRDPGGA